MIWIAVGVGVFMLFGIGVMVWALVVTSDTFKHWPTR